MADLRKSYAIVPNRSSSAVFTALPDPGVIPVDSTADAEKAKISGCESGFLFRYETQSGNHTNRLVRGVPDCLIKARENAAGFFSIPATSDPLVQWAPGSAYLDCMKNFLQWVRKRTVYNSDRYLTGTDGKKTWFNSDQENYASIFQRGVNNRKTGRPFAMSAGRAPRRG